MDTTTLNRRQRIDAAEAGLDRAVIEAAGAEKRKMRAMQELGDSDEHLTTRMQAVDKAREALAEALAYRDQPQASGGAVDVRDATLVFAGQGALATATYTPPTGLDGEPLEDAFRPVV
jgi:hypothetical protein